jgi:putrescine aminotransferase
MNKNEIYTLFAEHVSSHKPSFFKAIGIEFSPGRREGSYIWDVEGQKKLIDCHCNGGVFNLGHRNPEIIKTLKESLDQFDIGNHHLISEQRALLGRMIAELTPGDITYSVFGVGGGEAMDLAIKVARGHTGRQKVISAKGGYHGHTGLALAAGDAKYRNPFMPDLPDFLQVPFNDVETLADAMDENTAAVITETIPATFGMALPEEDYYKQVRELCDRHGAAMIIDEVQAGLGRTGRLWAITHYDVVPDIMVIGKGLSGGVYPITATCFKEKYESVFHADPFIHISTFGGAEVGCAVAMKVLEISSAPDFLAHVEHLGEHFAKGFEKLKGRHPVLTGLRRKGLMMGIELVDENLGPVFSKMAYDQDFLAIYANNDPRVVQLLPPLTITHGLADEILGKVDRALTSLEFFVQQQMAQHR